MGRGVREGATERLRRKRREGGVWPALPTPSLSRAKNPPNGWPLSLIGCCECWGKFDGGRERGGRGGGGRGGGGLSIQDVPLKSR